MSFEESLKLTYIGLKQLENAFSDVKDDSPNKTLLVNLLKYLEQTHGHEFYSNIESDIRDILQNTPREPTDIDYETSLLEVCPENYGDTVSLIDFITGFKS